MSTQLIGFSIAGICKHILVTPPSMIWPRNLASAALLNSFYAEETTGRGHIILQRFFTYIFVGYFIYSQLFSSFYASAGQPSS
jgi:OPT oligopeptide transporter protein